MGNLDKLFKPFIQTHDKDNWAGYVSPRMGYFNFDDEDSFGAGFLVANRYGTMDIPHIHDGAANFFCFTGADLDNIWESEFTVAFCIGDNADSMEIYEMSEPCFVSAPAGLWHSPVYFKNVPKGLNCMLWYSGHAYARIYPRLGENGVSEPYIDQEPERDCKLDPTKKCSFCGLCFTDPNQTEQEVIDYMAPFYANASKEGKFKDNVKPLRKDYHKISDAIMSPRAVFKGAEDMPGADRQFSINIITKPCKLGDDEPVSNGQVAEYLWFSGTDTTNSWDTFDADIEVMVGEDPGNMQAISFDKPGLIAIPPGIWRGPITIKRAGKPICFIPWYPHNKKRYKITQKIIDGKKVLVYDDESTIKEPTAGDELFMQIKR